MSLSSKECKIRREKKLNEIKKKFKIKETKNYIDYLKEVADDEDECYNKQIKNFHRKDGLADKFNLS